VTQPGVLAQVGRTHRHMSRAPMPDGRLLQHRFESATVASRQPWTSGAGRSGKPASTVDQPQRVVSCSVGPLARNGPALRTSGDRYTEPRPLSHAGRTATPGNCWAGRLPAAVVVLCGRRPGRFPAGSRGGLRWPGKFFFGDFCCGACEAGVSEGLRWPAESLAVQVSPQVNGG